MKNYTVKELAKKLCVTEEQVRRWIRDESMTATLKSKKKGYSVSEDGLNTFIKQHPKYDLSVEVASDDEHREELQKLIAELETQRDNLTLIIYSLKSRL